MRSLVIDNFLPYPHVVRTWALNQTYMNAQEYSQKLGIHTSWPGRRTDHVMDLDSDYANHVLLEFQKTVHHNYSAHSMSIRSYFQLCVQADGDSWVHQDNDVDIAGVLYLSPHAPVKSGTTTYTCKDPHTWGSLDIAQMKHINSQDRGDLYHTLFEPRDSFGNVFNRLIVYPGHVFHKSAEYFGTDLISGRLTQVFFARFDK